MILKILAQNALDAFSDAVTTNDYVALVERLMPDVAVFPEAYDATRPKSVPQAMKRLTKLGYQVISGLYDETDGRKDQHGIALIIRRGLVDSKKPGRLVRVGTHNVVEGWVLDTASGKRLHVVGVHLNDRTEAKRQAELDDLLSKVVDATQPTVIAGDLNSLYRQHAKGKEFRKAWTYTLLARLKLIPVHDPTGKPMPNNLGRRASIYTRLHQMASGKTLQRLEATGFIDADPLHRPTFPARQPVVQLDHMMHTNHIRVANFTLLPKNTSDHLGIVAEVTLD